MDTHWKHLIYGSDCLPTKEENSSFKRSFSPSFTHESKQFNADSSRAQTRFRHEFEKFNIASSQSEFNIASSQSEFKADGYLFDPQSSATSTSTLHSVNKNQPLTSLAVEVQSHFPKNLQEDESRELKFTKSMRSDGVIGMITSCKDLMESSSHPPILQSPNTHRTSTHHPKQCTNGITEEYHKTNSLKNSGNGKYLLNFNGGLKRGDDDDNDHKETTGVEEPMSFASQSCKSTEFDSLKCCSSGYEILRIQHFKVELKELKKEMQKIKQDNDVLLKENESLKEQLKRFHDKSITTPKGDCEISERSQSSTMTSTEFQADKNLFSARHENDVEEDQQTKKNKHLLTKRRRFSISSTTTENILQEAEFFVRSSNQERKPTIEGQQGKMDSLSLSSASTLNSHSEVESAYFNQPALKCDVELGDVVRFVSREGRMEQGKTMFLGTLPGKDFIYAGLELESEVGKHDGVYKGQRFFQCKRNRGIFVSVSKIVSIPSKSLPIHEQAKF